jgi:protein-tyrosine phosphatase
MKRNHSVRSHRMKPISWRRPELRFSAALERQTRILASKQFFAGQAGTTRTRHGNVGMDITWVTERIALGGGIWTADNMAAVARAGISHIIDMQIEFNDTPLAEPHGIEVLWNPADDDFQPKPPELFERGVDFALQALENEDARVFIHCAAGVHRAPMMTLAVLCSLGWELETAIATISSRRPLADFAEVYVNSVEKFLQQQVTQEIGKPLIE